jgi:predicted transcriptional regulator
MISVIVYEKTTGKILRSVFNTKESIEKHIKENEEYLLYAKNWRNCEVVNGEVVPISEEILEAESLQRKWNSFIADRNDKLKNSDWTQVPDAPVDSAAWAVYRQQLRDLPANTTDPRNVVWPEPPS